MRNVEFQEVNMENFGPYIDPMGYKFEKNKLTLITGANGSGKTMSLDAIPYTLFGITSKKAKGDDVVNNKVGKNCKTWVKFKVNDTDQYIVTRYHKYTKIGNTVILNKNGIDIKKGHREVLPEIEKIICSQKAFMNTIFFGQKVRDFFTDLVDSDKKEIFRKILGLNLYSLYYKQADDDFKETQAIYTNITNQIKIDTSLLEDTNQQIASIIEAKKVFDKKQKEVINNINIEIEQYEKDIKSLKEKESQIKLKDSNIDFKNEEISKIVSLLSNVEQKYKLQFSELNQKVQTKITEIETIANKIEMDIKNENIKNTGIINDKIIELTKQTNENNSLYREKIHDIELKKSKMYNIISSLKERINEINVNVIEAEISSCPTCLQIVDEKVKINLIKKINDSQEQIDLTTKTINIYETEIKSLKSELIDKVKKINDELAIHNENIIKLNNEEHDKYNKNKAKLKETLTKIKNLSLIEGENIEKALNKETETLKQNKNKLDIQKIEIEEVIENIHKIEKTINKIEYDCDLLIQKLNLIKEKEYDNTQLTSYENKKIELSKSLFTKKDELIKSETDMNILSFWKTAFSSSGIPSMLIDEAIPFMNKRITEYLNKITNGRYIVSFDTLNETKGGTFKDKISVNVIDTITQANSRVQLSGGQTRIVDIAIILTLGDLQSLINDVKFNLLLFDEIFDALDYDNVGYVSQTLNKLKIDKTIFIISHQHQDQLEPDETLTLS